MSEPKRDRFFYNEAFLEELEKLNPAQRKAVEQTEGPVLVIAGPGTGKTHMLASRIGKILLDSDTQAHNILCLTFTDAGVQAMRQRLLQLIGPEAYRVHIYTFHSFCNTIIKDNLELFGRRDLEPLSELERIDIIRSIIDELPVDHPIKRGRADVYFFEDHLYQLFKQMKAERWTVAWMEKMIGEFLDDLPKRKEFIYQVSRGSFKKGDLKEAKLKEVKRRMDRLLSACRLYPKYEQKMRKAKRYDYDDMILWVLNAFDKHEALLRSYQERYLYFLVDEYQDTNGAQNQLIRKLIEFWSIPNIFIVGDDDQSIFEFQGARLKNLTDFYKDYQQALETVLLQNNYRSSQLILDASTALINHNEKRIIHYLDSLNIDKILRAQHPIFGNQIIKPQINVYPNRTQEMVAIVEKLEAFQAQGMALDEIAIIYAKHRQADALLQLLDKKQIPYSVKRELNILHLPAIKNLRTILEYLWEESRQAFNGEYLLYQMLHFRYFGIQPSDFAEVSLALAGMGWRERPKWRKLLDLKGMLEDFNVKEPDAFLALSKFIQESLQQLYLLSLPAFVERVINRSGLLKFCMEQADRVNLLEVLKTFLDFVRSESMKHPRMNLGNLLEIFDKMEANRLSIPVYRTLSQENGVQLVTAHSAKGLEFRTVFIIDCIKDHWEPRRKGSLFRFQLPDTLTYSGEEDALEARRRLFYVSMTRAQEYLYLSYSLQNELGKNLEHTQFVDELIITADLTAQEKSVGGEFLLNAQELQLLEQEPPMVSVFEKSAVDQLLDGFVLSISSMNRYLSCPLAFFYEFILRVPVQVSESALYGTAMHNALQRLFEQMLISRHKQFPDYEILIRLYEQEIGRLRGGFSAKEFRRRKEMGKRQLKQYYRKNIASWPSQAKPEYAIRNIEIDGIPVTGVIDRLDWIKDQYVRIVDYKTGQPKDTKVKPPSSARPHGGPYWRQLYFYQLLYEHSSINQKPVRQGVISFLDPDKDGALIDFEVQFEREHTSFVKNLMKDTYQKIKDQQFYEGCNEPHCLWCNFFKKNVETDSFSNSEIEELDD